VILVLAWQHRRHRAVRPLAVALLALLAFQALLGMWTVTLKLMPLVVMGHLLGGFGILSLLWLWHLRAPPLAATSHLRGMALASLLALLAQIALGGWTSANYAAIACPDLPTCQGAWWPTADFTRAFSLPEPVNASYEFGSHDFAARTAIHLSHRIGSLVVLGLVGLLAVFLMMRRGRWFQSGLLLGAALLLQFSLGLANVLLQFPLAVAVAHTAGAALLLLALLHVVRSTLPARA
jgi:cytochrome c oxidase assembly protein subunit 15